MFILKPESIKNFISDREIKLPRFQRKQTWNANKNFNLCISVFKNFPIGVVVVKLDAIDIAVDGRRRREDVKWLLDGRQRLTALKGMKNPEIIYMWAKSAIGLKSSYDTLKVEELFWEYAEDYLQAEDEDSLQPSDTASIEDTPLAIADVEHEEIDDDQPQISTTLSASEVEMKDELSETYGRNDGLKDLLQLILAVHPLKKSGSGITTPFDFSKEISKLPYIRTNNDGKSYVDTSLLLEWLIPKIVTVATADNEFPPTQSTFLDWIKQAGSLQVSEEKLVAKLDRQWNRIKAVLQALDMLDKKLHNGQIGYLMLDECDDGDAKKIFEIINTAGTPLSAAEILSAKPSWNIRVDDPDPEIVKNKDKLYREIGVTNQDLVRWDVASTLLDRLDLQFILGRWD